MDKKEFSQIRHQLGKTQNELAQLLGTSLKAIQSFDQGWRKVPVHIERQILFLLSKLGSQNKKKNCWDIRKCPIEHRRKCPAWEFRVGQLCWFINGTICEGEVQANWQKKMKMCRKCEVFHALLPI